MRMNFSILIYILLIPFFTLTACEYRSEVMNPIFNSFFRIVSGMREVLIISKRLSNTLLNEKMMFLQLRLKALSLDLAHNFKLNEGMHFNKDKLPILLYKLYDQHKDGVDIFSETFLEDLSAVNAALLFVPNAIERDERDEVGSLPHAVSDILSTVRNAKELLPPTEHASKAIGTFKYLNESIHRISLLQSKDDIYDSLCDKSVFDSVVLFQDTLSGDDSANSTYSTSSKFDLLYQSDAIHEILEKVEDSLVIMERELWELREWATNVSILSAAIRKELYFKVRKPEIGYKSNYTGWEASEFHNKLDILFAEAGDLFGEYEALMLLGYGFDLQSHLY